MVVLVWILSFACIVVGLKLAYCILKYQWLKSLRVNAIVFGLLWVGGCALYCVLPCCAPPSGDGYAVSTMNSVEGINGASQIIAVTTTAATSRVECQTGESRGVSPLSAANRVTAAFFPSRGGFETTVSDNIGIDGMGWQFLYYLFHWLVVLYVALLVFSLFGRHLVDKYLRWRMRGGMLLEYISWIKDCSPRKFMSRVKRILSRKFMMRMKQQCTPLQKREEMCVFWGDPEPARILAENLRSVEGVEGFGFSPRIIFLLPGWLKYEDSARASILRLSEKRYVLDFVDGLPSDNDEYNVVGKEFELEDEDVAGRRHFLLSENSAYNIGLAKAIIKKRSETNCAYAKEKLDLYIRVENSASSGVLKDWADAMMRNEKVKSSVDLDIHIFRETEIMAEDFIQRYPILKQRATFGTDGCGWLLEGDGDQGAAKTRSGKDGLDVLIVGFGSRGQELLNKMLENSQFFDAEDKVIPTRFTIVDKCEVAGRCLAREIYKRRSPEIVEPPRESSFKVEFEDRAGDVSEDGFDHFDIKVSNYDRIVVCTGNDELNVQIGDIVRRDFIAQGVKLEPGRLFVQLQSNDVAEREEAKKELFEDKVWPIMYFGMWKDIFTYDAIVDEDKYYGAQLLNWRYCCSDETKLPGDCPIWGKDEKGALRISCDTVANEWRKAKWFDKESSVASYRGMKNILALMGYDLDCCDSPKADEGAAIRKMFADSKSKVLNRLSRDEHLRWMAFMRTHGVRYWDLIKPSIDEVDRIGKIVRRKEVKANVRELICRHGALTDYDDLPTVNMRLAKYNGACDCCENDFTGEGIDGRKGYQDNLQWNDMKFVKWIPTLFSELWEEINKGKRQKIVKIGY